MCCTPQREAISDPGPLYNNALILALVGYGLRVGKMYRYMTLDGGGETSGTKLADIPFFSTFLGSYRPSVQHRKNNHHCKPTQDRLDHSLIFHHAWSSSIFAAAAECSRRFVLACCTFPILLPFKFIIL